MIIDDEKPRPLNAPDTVGADLSRLSIPELQARVGALQAEVARTEAEIAKKQAQSSAAEAFFKSK